MKTFFSIFLILLTPYFLEVTFAQSPVTTWTYIEIDDKKSKWGDYAEPEWLRYFGLDMGDLNGDGLKDILTGRWIYLNPGSHMSGKWKKVDLGMNTDGILIMDVDGDEFGDLIAQSLPDVYWLESSDIQGLSWNAKKIGQIPATSHINSQGFIRKQIIAGGREEFLIAGDGDIYCFQLPTNTEVSSWKRTLVAANTSDEGIGVGDIDGDGDADIAAGRRPGGGAEPLILVWFENPGIDDGNWKNYEIGTTNHPIDRVAVADFSGDGKADVVVCEERWPGLEPDGNIFWFEQPEDPTRRWNKHLVTTQYSINNLDVEDVDEDGDDDIITCEHKGPNLELQLWKNDGAGDFNKEVIDFGKESHLGTQVEDMDGDGDIDIVSIGWDQYQYVHLWRNDRISDETRKWKRISSANGDLDIPNPGNQQTASLVVDADQDGINDFFITERTTAPAVTWYRRTETGWDRYIVEDEPLRIEAGSASLDIDKDGDEDIVFGGDAGSNEVWWWENPYPNFDPRISWNRHSIKKSSQNKHHDQLFGDFDADGQQELLFWNQGASSLVLAEIPPDPKNVKEWPMRIIYRYSVDSEMEPAVGLHGFPGWQSVNEHEGLAIIDMDGNGIDDIVGGGRWFKYQDGIFVENIIDASYTFSRSAAGQFIEGGRPEVLLVVGDGIGPLYMYEWHEWEGNKQGTGTWRRILLLEELYNGHTLDVLDFNNDGKLDIFIAEMRFGEANPEAKVRILLGDGKGRFQEMIIAEGYGVHEGKIADLDGDGDYDVLGKPYTWQAPLLNIWINEGR